MPTVKKRNTPLTVAEQDEFFDLHGHLAHRYTMLWTHKKRAQTPGLETCHLVCSLEASLVACRVFMEFLGLGVTYTKAGEPQLAEKHDYYSADGKTTDEVKVIDLRGTWAVLADIAPAERSILERVYHMAHKSTAHLTYRAPFVDPASLVHDAIPVIDRLLRTNLYDVVGKQPTGHWYGP